MGILIFWKARLFVKNGIFLYGKNQFEENISIEVEFTLKEYIPFIRIPGTIVEGNWVSKKGVCACIDSLTLHIMQRI